MSSPIRYPADDEPFPSAFGARFPSLAPLEQLNRTGRTGRPNPLDDDDDDYYHDDNNYGENSNPAGAAGVGEGSPRKRRRMFVESLDLGDDGLPPFPVPLSEPLDFSSKSLDQPPRPTPSLLSKGKEKRLDLGASLLGQTRTRLAGSSAIEGSSGSGSVLPSSRIQSGYVAKTDDGIRISIPKRLPPLRIGPEVTAGEELQRSFYGVDIVSLLEEASLGSESGARRNGEAVSSITSSGTSSTQLWTEKYRASRFTSLVGDERTHRHVLRWFKGWERTVFGRDSKRAYDHRRLLLLAGPAGYGKTTLAHVCAHQCGYQVSEINASDDRTGAIVKTRIKDMLSTESVRIESGKAGKPVCVVVDEVDGVVGGDGGFVRALLDMVERDARAAQAQTQSHSHQHAHSKRKNKKEEFRMRRPVVMICNDLYASSLRMLRSSPHVEIVNVRPPPLSGITARLTSIFRLEQVDADPDAVRRICEMSWGIESVRTAGASAIAASGGDLRGVLVTAEGLVRRWNGGRAGRPAEERMSRRWVESAMEAQSGKQSQQFSTREMVERVFREHAGLSQSELEKARVGSGSAAAYSNSAVPVSIQRLAMERLAQMLDGAEIDRVVSDIFASYPLHPFQDTSRLSKPLAALNYLFFHDQISRRVHSSHEWDLARYLNLATLAFHQLFSVSSAYARQHGRRNLPPHPTADAKPHAATISDLQAALPYPASGTFRSVGGARIVTDLVPYLVRMMGPDVKIVGGREGGVALKTALPASTDSDIAMTASHILSVRKTAEKVMLAVAVNAALATGLHFQRIRVEGGAEQGQAEKDRAEAGADDDDRPKPANPVGVTTSLPSAASWIYRLTPAIDTLATFEKAAREREKDGISFHLRRVIEAERQREQDRRAVERRRARVQAGDVPDDDGGDGERQQQQKKGKKQEAAALVRAAKVEVDFFGRPIVRQPPPQPAEGAGGEEDEEEEEAGGSSVWIKYNDGYSNAVRRSVTLADFLSAF